MKKIVWLAVVFSILAAPPAFAKEKKSVGTKNPKAASAPPSNAKREEMKKKIDEKKKELNGSEWKVALTSGGKQEGEDLLTFQNNQVRSKKFSDEGFPASNYTITVPEGSDMVTWETMQTHPKGKVIFMRGEWAEDIMRGVISEQLEEGKTRDYNFNSAGKTAVPPSTVKEKEAELPASEPAVPGPDPEVAAFDPGTTDEIRPRK